jgi:hypothetical protein
VFCQLKSLVPISISKNQTRIKIRTKFKIISSLGIKTIIKINLKKKIFLLEWVWLTSNKLLVKLKTKNGEKMML